MQKGLESLAFIFALPHGDPFIGGIQKSTPPPPNCPKLKLFRPLCLLTFLTFLWPFLFEMPQRRSQNLPLDDPLTPSRAFERRRKPTTQAEQSKTTDRAASLDRAEAVPFGRRRRRALISSNVDESRLSSSSELSSTSRQFSSQLSSLSWRSDSSSLRRSRSDSLSSLSLLRF